MESKKRLSFLNRALLLLNCLLLVATILAYASTRVSPVSFWPLAFFGMAFPYLLLGNVLFILWWLWKRWKLALLSLCTLLLGWNHVNATIGLSTGGEATEGAKQLKVMSYNVRLFDLYNWRDNKLTRNEIFDLLIVEDADIICLQEFFNAPKKVGFVTKDTIVNNFRQHHCHDDYVQKTKYGHEFGIATFSAYPIVRKGRIDFDNDINNLCIWSDISLKGDTIRVYNAHLASIGFQEADYELYDALDQSSIEKGGKRIGGLLKRAFVKRAFQAERIAAHMAECTYPIIYCGDLNDTPVSYSYGVLSAELEDAFQESGSGLGSTYVGNLPSFRIDHIMHSKELRAHGFRTFQDELSDHRPVSCWVEW